MVSRSLSFSGSRSERTIGEHRRCQMSRLYTQESISDSIFVARMQFGTSQTSSNNRCAIDRNPKEYRRRRRYFKSEIEESKAILAFVVVSVHSCQVVVFFCIKER